MTLIEQRARSQGNTFYIDGHAYLFPVLIAVSVLAAAAYLILIRSASRGLAQAGTVALGIALLGATLGVWSVKFLIRQGAPLGYDVYPDAFAFWYNGASVGAALAVFGIGAFAIVSLVVLARRGRR
ncbi:hypothetical protein [Gymnodinialimonas ulvae]|uniref:hypothetical protein n=1 Tax=Gymnodinialimonas ulvae TaxID=3126504 RepID=UPI00309CABBD